MPTKITNKYSGKKLKRPEIEAPYTKISRKMVQSTNLSDAQFRFICLLMSYSNGTTITTKNLCMKLNKTKQAILNIINQLAEKKILIFSTATLELVLTSDIFEGQVNLTPEDQGLLNHTQGSIKLDSGSIKLDSEGLSNLTQGSKIMDSTSLEHTDIDNVPETANVYSLNKILSLDKNLENKNLSGKILSLGSDLGVKNLSLDSQEIRTINNNQKIRITHNTPTEDLERSDSNKNTTNHLVNSTPIPTFENECQKIITHPNCKRIFQGNDKWQTFNERLTHYSDSVIGYEISKYLIKYYDTPNQNIKNEHVQFLQTDEGRFMNYLFHITKYSQRLEGSKIWQSLQYELGLEYKDRLLKTFDLS